MRAISKTSAGDLQSDEALSHFRVGERAESHGLAPGNDRGKEAVSKGGDAEKWRYWPEVPPELLKETLAASG